MKENIHFKRLDLTQGNLLTQILIFSLPLVVSNLLQVLFNIVDVAVVGRFAGSLALGSVGSTTTLVTLFVDFMIGFGGGINALVAKSIGSKNQDETKSTVHTAAILSLFTGIILLAAGIGFCSIILQVLGTKTELINGATTYLRIYFICMPAAMLFNFGSAVYSASGDTKTPLLFLTIAGVVNFGLNLLFVVVFELSVVGVAIASVIAQYLSASLILIALMNSKREVKLSLKDLKFENEKAKDILTLCIPSGLQGALFQIANLFVQAGVNTFDTDMVAGNSAAMNADTLTYDAMNAFYVACSSFLGQNYGAKDRKRMRRSYLICVGYSFLIAVVMGGSFVLFGKPFLSLFTTEQAVIEAGMKRLSIMGFSYAFSAFQDCTIYACRALGKSFLPTVIVMLGAVGFRITWIFTVFTFFQTPASLYLLYVTSWIITGIAECSYFAYIYRQKVQEFQSKTY